MVRFHVCEFLCCLYVFFCSSSSSSFAFRVLFCLTVVQKHHTICVMDSSMCVRFVFHASAKYMYIVTPVMSCLMSIYFLQCCLSFPFFEAKENALSHPAAMENISFSKWFFMMKPFFRAHTDARFLNSPQCQALCLLAHTFC